MCEALPTRTSFCFLSIDLSEETNRLGGRSARTKDVDKNRAVVSGLSLRSSLEGEWRPPSIAARCRRRGVNAPGQTRCSGITHRRQGAMVWSLEHAGEGSGPAASASPSIDIEPSRRVPRALHGGEVEVRVVIRVPV